MLCAGAAGREPEGDSRRCRGPRRTGGKDAPAADRGKVPLAQGPFDPSNEARAGENDARTTRFRSSHGAQSKDGLAMRLTYLGKRLALASALMGAIAPVAGCRRTPYLDQQKAAPHDPQGMAADEDS